MILKIIKWTWGVILDFEDLSPEGALITKKSKQMFKTAIFSLEPLPKGPQGGLQIRNFM